MFFIAQTHSSSHHHHQLLFLLSEGEEERGGASVVVTGVASATWIRTALQEGTIHKRFERSEMDTREVTQVTRKKKNKKEIIIILGLLFLVFCYRVDVLCLIYVCKFHVESVKYF